MERSYPAPVGQLLSLGMPATARDGRLDYPAMGLTDEHVPALLELIDDPSLRWDAWSEGEDETPFWAPVHAWRALGQLRAEAAVEPLLVALRREADDDWAMSEIPDALAMIGPAALGPIGDALPRAAREPEPWEAGTLGTALKTMARAHPETRGEAVSVLTNQLGMYGTQTPEINAFLISSLAELRAVDAAAVMEAAFAANAVDESVTGDWEDVQVELGLLAERVTPVPRYSHGLDFDDIDEFDDRPRPAPRPASPRPAAAPVHPAAKASQLRKKQKKASRRRRK